MSTQEPFDPLIRFAEIERLVAKIYFRFSHLFLAKPKLRDFWWEMAKEEEQHACILNACRAIIENYDEKLDPSISLQKADELKQWLLAYLNRGIASIGVEEAFRMAMEIEGSEIDAIYGRLLQLGGPKIAKTLENLGVPASVQRQNSSLPCASSVPIQSSLRAAEGL
jgi:hypothetical protein